MKTLHCLFLIGFLGDYSGSLDIWGTFELREEGISTKYVLKGNGEAEWHLNGAKIQEGGWSIQNGEVVLVNSHGSTGLLRIETNDDLRSVALLQNGVRLDLLAEEQRIYRSDKNPVGPLDFQDEEDSAQSDLDDKSSDYTIVYKTFSGTKYHREGCRFLSNSKIKTRLSLARVTCGP